MRYVLHGPLRRGVNMNSYVDVRLKLEPRNARVEYHESDGDTRNDHKKASGKEAPINIFFGANLR